MEKYSIKVESLHRLYKKDPKEVTLDELNRMLDEGKISKKEYNYIIET